MCYGKTWPLLFSLDPRLKWGKGTNFANATKWLNSVVHMPRMRLEGHRDIFPHFESAKGRAALEPSAVRTAWHWIVTSGTLAFGSQPQITDAVIIRCDVVLFPQVLAEYFVIVGHGFAADFTLRHKRLLL